jgi:hypothetical protein
MVNEPVNASSPAGDIAARRDAFLALSMTLVVTVMLDTFPESCWVANVAGVSSSEKSELSP